MPINVTALTAYAHPFGKQIDLTPVYSAQPGDNDFLVVARKRGSAWTTPEKAAIKTAITDGTYSDLVAESWKFPTEDPVKRYFRLIPGIPEFIDLNYLKDGSTYHYCFLVATLDPDTEIYTYGTERTVICTPEQKVEYLLYDLKEELARAVRFAATFGVKNTPNGLVEGKDYQLSKSYPETPVDKAIQLVLSKVNGDPSLALLDAQDDYHQDKIVKTWIDTDVFRLEARCPTSDHRDKMSAAFKIWRFHIIQYLKKNSAVVKSVKVSIGGDQEEVVSDGGGVYYLTYMNISIDNFTRVEAVNPNAGIGPVGVSSTFG